MSTAIQKQGQQSPKAKTDAFMHEVVTRKTTFQRLLPKGMDPDWFTAEVRVAVARAPKLLECDRVSVIDALTTCAQLGLSPSGRLGSAYLIPYGQKCQLVVGYRGMCDLAYRSGEIIAIGAQVVHENDVFEPNEGFDLTIRHVRTEDEPGALRAVYAWAHTRGGGTIKCLMLRREVLAIKARSPGAAKTDSPWRTNEEEMWKKTCLRRMFKVSPLSPQKAQGLSRALEAEDAEFEDIAADVSAVDDAPATGTEGLKRQLKAGSRGERIEEAVAGRPEPLPISHPEAQPPEPGAMD
jgi:recombination protein RecT